MASEAKKAGSRLGRLNYPRDFKRQLAAEACTGNLSVTKIAQQHGVNPNMLFKWRRQYRAGLLGAAPATEQARLLPVITAADTPRPLVTTSKPPAVIVTPTIEITIADLTLRLHGSVSENQLRMVLRSLGHAP